MALTPGLRLGPYEIQSLIGAGGMGEVYQGIDTRLNRTVAIKVLPPQFSENPVMKARLEREARTVASLNHPHICVLHDFGRQDGMDFLVMEHLEGETLARRIERGPVPLPEALKLAVEITDALDKAHRQNVVHRDVKPSNVMLTKAGTKLLDFGLAKPLQGAAAVEMSSLPTRVDDTTPGTIIGTVQYMAPEQLEGREADARSDIFAFGALLFEMTTGRRAFEGSSRALLISAIMTAEPPPLSKVLPSSPHALDHVLQRCLAKDPEDRWQSARDLTNELRWIAHEGAHATGGAAPRRGMTSAAVLTAIAVLTASVLALVALLFLRGQPEPEEEQFHVAVPATPAATDIAVSPDGRWIAYVAFSPERRAVLFVRRMASVTPEQLPGTEGASKPFWSPNSRSIGFVAGQQLRTVDVLGGPPQDVTGVNATVFSGGSWNRDGTIIFAPGATLGGVLHRVPATGGEPIAITSLDTAQEETGHLWPCFLPDGRHFVYLAWSAQSSNRALYVGSLDSKERTRLLAVESMPVYAEPGYLIFRRGGTLFSQPFDLGAPKLTGESVRIADQIAIGGSGLGAFTASQTGVLVYRASGGSAANRRFVWFDRKGNQQGAAGEPGLYTNNFDMSPDGSQVAVARLNPVSFRYDIWRIDLDRGDGATPVTSDPALSSFGNVVWGDGRIAFASERKGNRDIFETTIDGGAERPLLDSPEDEWPEDWSSDGRYIVYGVNRPSNSSDIWALPLFGDQRPFPVVQSPFADDEPRLSRDVKWLAYNTDESGPQQVYVVSFPAGAQRHRVTTNGGVQPRWSHDGRELYYLALDGYLMVVDMAGGVNIGAPRRLFDTRMGVDMVRDQFAVTGDGSRFLVELDVTESVPTPLTVVPHWKAPVTR